MKKLIDDVEPGEVIRIAGIDCLVYKKNFVHYYTDDSTVRLELHIGGKIRPTRNHATLFLPRGTEVKIKK